MSTIIGLKELRENTEAVAERVARGESFVVVKRSKPVFQLIPVDDTLEATEAWVQSYIAKNRDLLISLADK